MKQRKLKRPIANTVVGTWCALTVLIGSVEDISQPLVLLGFVALWSALGLLMIKYC